MSTKPELLIEVYTDPQCPWCEIGHARLEETLQSKEFQDKIGVKMQPVVKLRPYLLDTRLPGTDYDPPCDKYDTSSSPFTQRKPPTKREYYSKKFTNLDAFDAKISKAAEEVHLQKFQWLTEGKVGATWLAHRLLWYALQQQEQQLDQQQQPHLEALNANPQSYCPSLQEKLATRLYLAFHNESQDLSSFDVLASLAVEVGVFTEKEKAIQWLQSDDGDYELGHAVDMGMMNGVQSVPFLILQDGSDHTSEVPSHSDLMRMFSIQADMVT